MISQGLTRPGGADGVAQVAELQMGELQLALGQTVRARIIDQPAIPPAAVPTSRRKRSSFLTMVPSTEKCERSACCRVPSLSIIQ